MLLGQGYALGKLKDKIHEQISIYNDRLKVYQNILKRTATVTFAHDQSEKKTKKVHNPKKAKTKEPEDPNQ